MPPLTRSLLDPRRLLDLALAGWFLTISAALIFGPALRGDPFRLGWDAIVYSQAARALLGGLDPWTVTYFGIVYAAPPPSLIPYLPFAFVPDSVAAAAWLVIDITAAVYAVRKLELAWWWLLFPPVLFGIAAGSSAVLVLALLARAGVFAEAAAVVARVYAVVPLLVLARWRAIAVAAGAILVTAPFLGWPMFLAGLPEISRTLTAQAGGGLSATVAPLLFAVAVLSLVALGRRRAAWLIVPALWPDTQLYYATVAMPVIAEVPLVALAIASPASAGLVAIGLAAQAFAERLVRWPPFRRPVDALAARWQARAAR